MPKTLDDHGTLADGTLAVGDGPGQAMRAVAEKLAAHGFAVQGPEWDEDRCLTVTGLRGTTCDITVDDGGSVTWEYRPGGSADPDTLADRVVHLLTSRASLPYQRQDLCPEPRAGLKGLVGRRLMARGLAVCLEVYEDHLTYEVSAEISVTHPGYPERGRVHVADDGALTWECDYGDHGIDTGVMAGVIAAIVAGDIAQGCVERTEPGPAGGGRETR